MDNTEIIKVPVYYVENGKEIIIDIEAMREEFEIELEKVIARIKPISRFI